MASDPCPTCPNGTLRTSSALVCPVCWTLVPTHLRDVLYATWINIGEPARPSDVLEAMNADPEGFRAYRHARDRVLDTIEATWEHLERIPADG